ncbi:hypothetical protein ADL15_10750 [Actinoplanes awajinensis subsp. mycoplanecinus]|uniref:Putative zinc-finger domain-containing protein n=1 Tax=Actinoplanes awajinensis subsp. mycoplanecinus TaxID=135947 RepID=A0A0X3V2V1_9ACTN|nr:zf-HC2 domain-containing protein [Actinoplanes awajinensis]KUL39060.1 hypothetical protein ADL15_10750 [Actinoplanes awajinensis subsp. mycoplanecinus]
MRCEDGHDDAAYVLGALSPAERAAYESHLASCSFCREAVADLARVPDMLDRLDADEFARLLDPSLSAAPPARGYRPAPPPVKAFPVRMLSTVAALVLIVVLGGGATLWLLRQPEAGAAASGPAVAMSAVEINSPITATIRLTGTAGGTKVEMLCRYAASAKPYTYRLIAYGPDDQSEQLGSWTPQPGAEFPMQSVTHFAEAGLDRFELVRFDGKVMLSYQPR